MHAFDKLHEECGVFGIYLKDGKTGVVPAAYHALYALQHRGQESCGIAVNNDGVIDCYKDVGLVNEVFTRDVLEKLHEGSMAVGHCRYGTTGTQSRGNAQPLLVNHLKGALALCHNGNLVNARELREELELGGAIFHTTSDTEVIAYIITQERLRCDSIEQAVLRAMERIEGAYSLVIMSPQKLIAARDPHGFRPLCMGDLDGDVVFASESCALDAIGATFVRDIEPGETVVVSAEGIKSLKCGRKCDSSLCVFEFIYFARPDSVVDGSSVHVARLRAGAFLALDHPVQADVVIGVPDSGIDAAIGYARQSGIPYGDGLAKNRYVGRTFIQPEQGMRELGVRTKLNALTRNVRGKRLILVDDSIVRGTTSRKIVEMLRTAGAKEVHMRISSPSVLNPCYFGIDTATSEELIGHSRSVEEICRFIGADSLKFLSLPDLLKTVAGSGCQFCTGCFDGDYPTSIPEDTRKDQFEQKLSQRKAGKNP